MTTWNGPHIRTAGGHLVAPSGRCTSRVTINGSTYPASFEVLPNCSRDVILVMDVLSDNGAIIDLEAKSISLSSDHAVATKRGSKHRTALRIAGDPVSLPPRACLMITVHCPYSDGDCEAVVEYDPSLLFARGVSVARGIVRLQRRKAQVLWTNFTETYQHLNKGASVAFLEEITEDSNAIAVAEFESESDYDSKAQRFFEVNTALPPEKQDKL